MNSLLIGNADKTKRLLQLAQQPFLLIDDGELCDAFLREFPRATLFDIAHHTFNPLQQGIDYKGARDFATAIYGEKDLMTYRDGKRALTRILLQSPRLDKLTEVNHKGTPDALDTIDDLLLSPVLRRVLCNPTNFSFKGSMIAKIDRAEVGDFDAFVLAVLLVQQFRKQVIVPDFGFYARDFHTSLIRENRLVASLNSLSEVSAPMQQALLGIKSKTIYRTTSDDAKRLIVYTKHQEPNILTRQEGTEYTVGE
jgi:hypothetical protein